MYTNFATSLAEQFGHYPTSSDHAAGQHMSQSQFSSPQGPQGIQRQPSAPNLAGPSAPVQHYSAASGPLTAQPAPHLVQAAQRSATMPYAPTVQASRTGLAIQPQLQGNGPSFQQQEAKPSGSGYRSQATPATPQAAEPDHRALFHAYIYEYLYRQGFHEAALAFLHNAPDTSVDRSSTSQSAQSKLTARENRNVASSSRLDASSPPAEGNSVLEGLDALLGAVKNSPIVSNVLGKGKGKATDAARDDPANSKSATRRQTALAPDATHDYATGASAANGADSSTSSDRSTSSRFSFANKRVDADNRSTESTSADREAEERLSNNTSPAGTTASPTARSANGDADILDVKSSPQENDNLRQMDIASLPRPMVQLGSAEGFLFEWWTVFWDVFRAKGDRTGSQAARNYVETKGIVNGAQHRVRFTFGLGLV